MKIYLVNLFLLLNVAASFTEDVAPPEKVAIPLDSIHSAHIPRYLPALNLTPGELKIFAGHSFNLLKSKCPAVSKDTLSQLNKYVSKLISKSNPAPSKSKVITSLVSSISACSDKEATQEDNGNRQEEMSFIQTLLSPFMGIRGIFRLSGPDDTKDTPDISTPAPTPTETTPRSFMVVQKADEKETETTKDSTGNEAPVVVPSGGSDESSTSSPPTGYFPLFHTIYISEEPQASGDDSSFFNPSGWFSSMYSVLRDFFASFFGNGGDDLSTTSPVARAKRSAEKQEPDELQEPKLDFTEELSIPAPSGVEDANDDDAVLLDVGQMEASTKSKGRVAFLKLVDNICRIYCAECSDFQRQIFVFKAAAKELLQLIFTDTTGIELAAKHYIDDSFLESLATCTN